MEFFKTQTKVPFMQQRFRAFIFSTICIIASILSIYLHGLTMSLDFTGGHQVQLQFEKPVPLEKIRQNLNFKQQIGLQTIGNARSILLRVPYSKESAQSHQLRAHITKKLPHATIEQISFIGPQIGAALLLDGINAMAIALLITMAYITYRFEYRFAISAMVALLHDPIITLGIFSFFSVEFDIISLAGILTILGYSLNDTIVVYDRVRENHAKNPKMSASAIVDLAINDTLSRTIITSGLTLLAVLALCFYGGESLWGFSLALAIGIVVGTYSSIYVAGALSVVIGLKPQDLIKTPSTNPKVITDHV
jgi:preprotein translocase subunit SecF